MSTKASSLLHMLQISIQFLFYYIFIILVTSFHFIISNRGCCYLLLLLVETDDRTVNTKVDMRFNVKDAYWLSDRIREKIVQMVCYCYFFLLLFIFLIQVIRFSLKNERNNTQDDCDTSSQEYVLIMCLSDNGITIVIVDNTIFKGRGGPSLALLIAKYHLIPFSGEIFITIQKNGLMVLAN